MYRMFWNTILVLVTAIAARGADADGRYHLSDEFIEEINAKATTWTAGRNFPNNTSDEFMKSLSCAWSNSTGGLRRKPFAKFKANLPENFDARTKWSSCPSLNEIRNQGHCGSCWAVSVASVISDRECVQKKVQFQASAEDLVSCCEECGAGCFGGNPAKAFGHYTSTGVVSGGGYGTQDGCKPYSSAEFKDGNTPKCQNECTNSAYPKTYTDDLHRGTQAYTVSGEEQMKQELFTNGPMTVAFTVYYDFMTYKQGVYKHVGGAEKGGHAVKLIGWGVENGTPYWLIANSWGTDWGDNGYVKFVRGTDDCGIESQQVATAMA